MRIHMYRGTIYDQVYITQYSICVQEDFQSKGSYLQIVKVGTPRQIAFATTGEMVVCEFESNCVAVFDPSSHYRRLH